MMNRVCGFRFPDGSIVEVHRDEDATSPRQWDNLWEWWAPSGGVIESDLEGERGHPNLCEMVERMWNSQEGKGARSHGLHQEWEGPILVMPAESYTLGAIVGWAILGEKALLEGFPLPGGGGVVGEELWEKAKEILLGEVEVFNQYLSGSVWGFILRGKPCEHCGGEGEEVESCWGLFGDDPEDLEDLGVVDYLGEEQQVWYRGGSFEKI